MLSIRNISVAIVAALIFLSTSNDRCVAATGPALSPDFINFGYLQNNGVLPYLHYEAITHIAAPFVNFDTDGNLINPGTFSGRSSYLKAGGAAQRAGTKIIACVRNNGFDEAILNSVMQSSSKRATLISQVASLVTSDAYCAGVNFDFEFSWGAATRNGITAFVQGVRAALPSQYEVSVYTHAIYDTNRWDIPDLVNSIDYMLYSTYDWGTGSTAHAIADFNNCVPNIVKYLNAGLPPEKLVLTWASYGRRWAGANGYNDTGSYKQSQGFYNGLYDTTIRQANGGPFTLNYLRGDETGWYTYNDGSDDWTAVSETVESLEYRIAAALNFPGDNGQWGGVRLGGVGWWSLMWASNYFDGFDSYDPITNSTVGRPPYYRHIDQAVQEILKTPGATKFPMESFEKNNHHWRDPNESPDTSGDTDSNSLFDFTSAPGTVFNRPPNTTRAGRLRFDFEQSSGNRAFLRYEMLNNDNEHNITDANAGLAMVSKNTRFTGYYYVSGNYSNRNMRLAVADGHRSSTGKPQIEVSKPFTLPSSAGWHTFQWDLNDTSQLETSGWTTSEPALQNGNGVIDTASPDARDISFLGFIVEGGPAGSGYIYFDELAYENHAPGNLAYTINEFRYNDPASEYVEIAGPPGPFPSDLKLIAYNSADGSTYKTTSLQGRSIPASGVYVIGDNSVTAATGSAGFRPFNWSVGADLLAQEPGGLQLYGSSSGYVYDSVAFAAYGGLGDLTRLETRRVTGEGYGWVGNVASGVATNNEDYSMGRMPDGVDTNINEQDFSFMPPTPGSVNGTNGSLMETLFDFTTAPANAFQTYQGLKLENPVSAGLPASPGGGNAYRCIDTSGGGVIGVFGDAAMSDGRGLDVTGKLYIPASAHPAQSVAVGFCGTQGSTFFTDYPEGSGYENGYWLIYENGVADLNDSQPNHPGQFQLVMASNNNQDSQKSTALGAKKSLAQVAAAANTWVDFHLRIDPSAPLGAQLIAQINNIYVYTGPIPEGGRQAGAFMVGFRENHGGGVGQMEGAWIDNLKIDYATPPARVEDFELY